MESGKARSKAAVGQPIDAIGVLFKQISQYKKLLADIIGDTDSLNAAGEYKEEEIFVPGDLNKSFARAIWNLIIKSEVMLKKLSDASYSFLDKVSDAVVITAYVTRITDEFIKRNECDLVVMLSPPDPKNLSEIKGNIHSIYVYVLGNTQDRLFYICKKANTCIELDLKNKNIFFSSFRVFVDFAKGTFTYKDKDFICGKPIALNQADFDNIKKHTGHSHQFGMNQDTYLMAKAGLGILESYYDKDAGHFKAERVTPLIETALKDMPTDGILEIVKMILKMMLIPDETNQAYLSALSVEKYLDVGNQEKNPKIVGGLSLNEDMRLGIDILSKIVARYEKEFTVESTVKPQPLSPQPSVSEQKETKHSEKKEKKVDKHSGATRVTKKSSAAVSGQPVNAMAVLRNQIDIYKKILTRIINDNDSLNKEGQYKDKDIFVPGSPSKSLARAIWNLIIRGEEMLEKMDKKSYPFLIKLKDAGLITAYVAKMIKKFNKRYVCSLIFTSLPPNPKKLDKLPGSFNAAYVYVIAEGEEDRLFYINKKENTCIELVLTRRPQTYYRHEGDIKFDKLYAMAGWELDNITSITGHEHQMLTLDKDAYLMIKGGLAALQCFYDSDTGHYKTELVNPLVKKLLKDVDVINIFELLKNLITVVATVLPVIKEYDALIEQLFKVIKTQKHADRDKWVKDLTKLGGTLLNETMRIGIDLLKDFIAENEAKFENEESLETISESDKTEKFAERVKDKSETELLPYGAHPSTIFGSSGKTTTEQKEKKEKKHSEQKEKKEEKHTDGAHPSTIFGSSGKTTTEQKEKKEKKEKKDGKTY